MKFCDLHAHSTASDGTTPPEELAVLAKHAGLQAIALTDHDTTAGLPACAQACKKEGIEFVPGIEVSIDPGSVSQPLGLDKPIGTLHVLGLFIRHDDSQLQDIRIRMHDARRRRNPQMIEKLNALGLDIDYQDVIDLAHTRGSSTVTRPHIAQVLVDRGHAVTVRDAFDRYIGEGAPAYVRRQQLIARDAIAAIHHAGGLAIIAHPVQLKIEDPAHLEQFMINLKELGLDGIETRHSDHDADDVERYERLAEKLDLLTSGGSDYHGPSRRADLGSQRVPISVYEALRDHRK